MKEHEYLTYSIIAGLLFGTVMAVVAHLNIGICVGLAMLLGIVIGTTIDYEKKKKSDR